jgi:hypothetical protein
MVRSSKTYSNFGTDCGSYTGKECVSVYLLAIIILIARSIFGHSGRSEDLIIAEDQVFDGFTEPLIFPGDRATDTNPNVRKVVRNCVFKNSNQIAILIRDARNILVDGCTFENLRSGISGKDLGAIKVDPNRNTLVDNVSVQNCIFKSIGSDGIAIGARFRYSSNVRIENNEFYVKRKFNGGKTA